MKRVKYFVAMSLDGYIADADGGVGWLFTDRDYGMKEFFATVDTALIGRKTYEFMLAHGSRVYPGITNIVFSRTLDASDSPGVEVVADDPVHRVQALRQADGKDIWLVGGGELCQTLLTGDCVDEVIVAVHPILLGRGIPMLPDTERPASLRLAGVTPFDTGLVTLRYQVNRGEA